jgi:hypothetical protein
MYSCAKPAPDPDPDPHTSDTILPPTDHKISIPSESGNNPHVSITAPAPELHLYKLVRCRNHLNLALCAVCVPVAATKLTITRRRICTGNVVCRFRYRNNTTAGRFTGIFWYRYQFCTEIAVPVLRSKKSTGTGNALCRYRYRNTTIAGRLTGSSCRYQFCAAFALVSVLGSKKSAGTGNVLYRYRYPNNNIRVHPATIRAPSAVNKSAGKFTGNFLNRYHFCTESTSGSVSRSKKSTGTGNILYRHRYSKRQNDKAGIKCVKASRYKFTPIL